MGLVIECFIFISLFFFFVFVFLPFVFEPPQRGSRLIARPPGGPNWSPPIIAGLSGVQGGRRPSVLIELVLRDRIRGFGAPPPIHKCRKLPNEETALVKPG